MRSGARPTATGRQAAAEPRLHRRNDYREAIDDGDEIALKHGRGTCVAEQESGRLKAFPAR